jgi:hypothetical protein
VLKYRNLAPSHGDVWGRGVIAPSFVTSFFHSLQAASGAHPTSYPPTPRNFFPTTYWIGPRIGLTLWGNRKFLAPAGTRNSDLLSPKPFTVPNELQTLRTVHTKIRTVLDVITCSLVDICRRFGRWLQKLSSQRR